MMPNHIEWKTPLRVHLGCGERYIPYFDVHIDLADLPHINFKQDIRNLPMFSDEVVDLIYCSHALQYLDLYDVYFALKEWWRVLKKGGILRLAVPDFAGIVKVYQEYGTIMEGPIYGPMLQGDKIIRHKVMYDFSSLRSILELVGFRDVKRYDWRKTIHKDYDDFSQAYFPHMDKEGGVLVSLNVEATK